MSSRLSAFVIWALVALVAMFWGLRLTARAAPAPANAVPVNDSVRLAGDMTRLFGAEPVAQAEAPSTPTDSRFKLIGVMAARPDDAGLSTGLALIAIDDKPARPFAAGARIDERLVLKTVGPRSAALGPQDGAATIVLEIPPLAAPATGELPAAAPGIEPVIPPSGDPQHFQGNNGVPSGSSVSPEYAPQPMRAPPPQSGS